MRMWGIDPRDLCRQHLLGEHVEMHMVVGSLLKGMSVEGFTSTGLIDLRLVRSRHINLAMEMRRRGMNHNSPLKALPHRLPLRMGSIDLDVNRKELARRCPNCRALMKQNHQ